MWTIVRSVSNVGLDPNTSLPNPRKDNKGNIISYWGGMTMGYFDNRDNIFLNKYKKENK
jgi:hypothetical protein